MGKIRTIKPELFTHEDLFALEKESGYPIRTAFAGLFTCCDREGRFKWKVQTLKLGCLPFDELNFAHVLDALMTRGFVEKYENETGEFGHIPTWSKHQFINNRESESELPDPEKCAIFSRPCTYEARDGHASNTRHEGKGKEGKGKEGNVNTPMSNSSTDVSEPANLPKSASLPAIDLLGDESREVPKLALSEPGPAEQVFRHWQTVMGHPQAKLDAKRKRNIAARLKDGYTVDQLLSAIDGCLLSDHHMGKNDTGTIYDDIELICRDGPRIDKFIKLTKRGPPQAHNGMSKNTNTTIDNINRVLERRKHENRG